MATNPATINHSIADSLTPPSSDPEEGGVEVVVVDSAPSVPSPARTPSPVRMTTEVRSDGGVSLAVEAADEQVPSSVPAGAAVGVYGIGSAGRGGATPVKLALAGAALGALFLSVTSSITFLNSDTFERFRFWLIGSLTRADLGSVAQAAPFVLTGTVLALALGRSLNLVQLGDDLASGLGARIRRVRVLGMVAVVLLAGTATAVAGPIAFIGLVAPHLARLVAGADQRWLLPWAAVFGATILLLADVLGGVVLAPEEVQVGVLAGVVGAPVFLYLVRRRTLAQL